MNITYKIRQLIKSSLVVRHRTDKEQRDGVNNCLICCRELQLPEGALCLAVNEEGLVCSICGKIYAPELVKILGEQLPKTDSNNNSLEKKPKYRDINLSPEWITLAREIDTLSEVTADLAKGIARGIVEAPAGHIGLMHYAKNIKKPPRKENESEKDYELRVRTHRMTWLYDKIHADTTGRVNKLKEYLQKCGLPFVSD